AASGSSGHLPATCGRGQRHPPGGFRCANHLQCHCPAARHCPIPVPLVTPGRPAVLQSRSLHPCGLPIHQRSLSCVLAFHAPGRAWHSSKIGPRSDAATHTRVTTGRRHRTVQPLQLEDRFMVSMNRRQFLKVSGTGLAGSSLALLGASPAPAMAEVRQFKLARMTETRNTCPYCSVACGILMYGLGDGAKNAAASIVHIEGDQDHPVNRGTLCPKGAGLLDFVNSPNRLRQPEYRAPGSDKWEAVSWDDAIDRV